MEYSRNNISGQIKIFTQMMLVVKIFRFLFFSYSFISFLFWFLNCFEIDWLYLFTWLFVIPYQLVSLFYKVEGVSADFSLAIVGCISLLLGFVFEFLINCIYQKIYDLEDMQEKLIRQQRMKAEKKKTVKSSASVQNQNPNVNPFENSKLLFIVQLHINKIKRKKEDMELTIQDVEIWKQRVNKKLLENVNYSKPTQKGYYRKNLFLMYKNFNYVDDFLYYIRPTLDSIVLEFRKYGISVSYSYVLSALTKMENLEKELDCMDTILSLNFLNVFIATNRFKITYDNKPTHQYKLELKGEYNLSKNLSVSNKQPIYSLLYVKRGE